VYFRYTTHIGSYTSIEGIGQGVYQTTRSIRSYTSIEGLGQGQGVYQVKEYRIQD